jgi:hypothetical protein
MVASVSDPLLKEFAYTVWDDWYYNGGVWGDDSEQGASSVIDFRVDEDVLILAATEYFIGGPDYLSVTFTDGDLVVNRFFEKQELSGNGYADALIVNFDGDAGMVGATRLTGFGSRENGEAIYTETGDLVQLIGMRGAGEAAVEMMFENAGLLGYEEVSKGDFLIGLGPVDGGGVYNYSSGRDPYAA